MRRGRGERGPLGARSDGDRKAQMPVTLIVRRRAIEENMKGVGKGKEEVWPNHHGAQRDA